MPVRARHVILDRDGVLNVERRDGGYVEAWSQWRWISGSLTALGMLSAAGVHLSIATNQAGVGRGLVTADALDAIHRRMLEEAAQAGAVIARVFVCPHLPSDGCACRKPAPGLLLEAMEATRIPAEATVVVGDDVRDVQAARAAGIVPMLVRTGKGHLSEAVLSDSAIPVFNDLQAFASAFLAPVRPAFEGIP